MRREGQITMCRVDDELRKLAEQVMAERSDLKKLANPDCRIAFLRTDKKKTSHGRTVFADTEKVSEKVKALAPYDFIITFYDPACAALSEEKMKVLMIHELKHVGFEPGKPHSIIPHDLEDFRDIVETYGMDWTI